MSGGDDDRVFEEAMRQLGLSARGQRARGEADFAALMAEAGAEDESPQAVAETGGQATPMAQRDAALADEDALFLAAMSGEVAAPPEAPALAEAAVPPEAPRRKRRPTARRSLVRMLKAGDLTPQATLDLHRKTLGPAKIAVRMFLSRSIGEDLDTVLIISGRGLHSHRGAVMRDAVERWLKGAFRDWIVDFFPAPPALGGEGAWVVLPRRKHALEQSDPP